MSDTTAPISESSGHRERLRAKFLAGDATDETSLLELLLTYAIPRRDVRPLAKALLARFGSASSVLAASVADLQKISGIKESTAVLLKLTDALAGRQAENPISSEALPQASDDPPEENETPDTEVTPENLPAVTTSPMVSKPASKAPKRSDAPKLQVSNCYSLDATQTARLLTYIVEHPDVRKFVRRDLMEGTGLSKGQVESLTSIAVAMGMLTPLTALLSPFGRLVHQHDLFLDSSLTLEFCHFLGAGSPRNLIWHTIFNEILPFEKPTTQAGWCTWLREKLAGQYSHGSLMHHVAYEVRFVVDAYTVKNFKKLNIIYETPDKTLALRRYTALQPLSLAAMIYWIGNQHEARLVSFEEIQAAPGSPGRVFGLDASSMRQMVELLHQKGWIRYEVRHGLDQVRLVDGFEPLEFLAAGYENREPEPKSKPDVIDGERLLL
jgi:hypothetical protein